MGLNLSVIIPALNEQGYLPLLLADLKAQKNVNLQIIISDGGSTDETIERCRPFGPVIVKAPGGRASQLNAGFRKSTGNNLLFLHADTRIKDPLLLANALEHWGTAITHADHDRVAGHFPLKFIRTTQINNMSFRYAEGKTHFNRINTTNGDQGLLLRRSFFESLGGFDESQHFLEDQKLAEKIRIRGIWITLPGLLYTSGRRFETEGFHRRYILMGMLMALYSTGRMEFFQRAKAIYASQSETGYLLLKPYFEAAIKMFVYDLGFSASIRAWFYIGRYIRQNSWQMFYFFDVLCRTAEKNKDYPFLRFHDNYFWPVTNNSVCDALNTLISFFWYMVVLTPYFFLVDTFRPDRSFLSCKKQSIL
ncbi:MAG: TIGR04283 family arsenosugar biosynthesis glycosyltransferase [Thermodesulfobacteriota bacterium]|nr:TIGR04283 family arsenosugar biosynthesis glycosyltransferase [Thermodesulfobacteriota bacterium]